MGKTTETPKQVLVLQTLFDAGVGIGRRDIAKQTRLTLDEVNSAVYHLSNAHKCICNIGPGQYTTTELGKHVAGLSFSNPGMPIKKLIELYLKKKKQAKPLDEATTEAIKEKMLSKEEPNVEMRTEKLPSLEEATDNIQKEAERLLPRSPLQMSGDVPSGYAKPIITEVPRAVEESGHTKLYWEENYVALTNRLVDLMGQKGISGTNQTAITGGTKDFVDYRNEATS